MKSRNISAKEKFDIVMEGLVSGNIAETCRRRGISTAQFYQWKSKFEEGAVKGLSRKERGSPGKKEALLESRVEKLKDVIYEITMENIELKKSYEDRREEAIQCRRKGGIDKNC